MAVEFVTKVEHLNEHWPLEGDIIAEGAAHIRNVKTATKELAQRISGDNHLHFGVHKQILTANTTYYVAPTGSDTTGDGSAGNPWRNIQHAIDYVVKNLDTAKFDVYINVAAGTYTKGLWLRNFSGGGRIIIKGDENTPSNVVLHPTAGSAVISVSSAPYHIRGMKVLANNAFAFYVTANHCLYFKNVEFGEVGTGIHILVDNGYAQATGNYTISGSASKHLYLINQANFNCEYKTITITGTLSFSYIWADVLSGCRLNGCSFIGNSTGQRYNIKANSVCFVGGAGSTYLPGDTAGTTFAGGQYV